MRKICTVGHCAPTTPSTEPANTDSGVEEKKSLQDKIRENEYVELAIGIILTITATYWVVFLFETFTGFEIEPWLRRGGLIAFGSLLVIEWLRKLLDIARLIKTDKLIIISCFVCHAIYSGAAGYHAARHPAEKAKHPSLFELARSAGLMQTKTTGPQNESSGDTLTIKSTGLFPFNLTEAFQSTGQWIDVPDEKFRYSFSADDTTPFPFEIRYKAGFKITVGEPGTVIPDHAGPFKINTLQNPVKVRMMVRTNT